MIPADYLTRLPTQDPINISAYDPFQLEVNEISNFNFGGKSRFGGVKKHYSIVK
jgi:hypothetical protein